jgi:DNA-binding protein H-NS
MMDEIEKLHQQIAELTKKAEELALKKKEPIIEDMKAKIKLYGITAKDLGFVGSTKEKPLKTSTVAIKYKQGENTWTGRGRQPKFIVDHLATGAKLEELLVK